MRPYPVADDELYDHPSPRVVPVGTAGPPAAGMAAVGRVAEPWVPRDYPIPAAPRRAEPPPVTPPAPVTPPPPAAPVLLTTTHKIMLVVFALICLAVILGTVTWRVFGDSRRPVEDPIPATVQPVTPPPPAPTPAAPQPTLAVPGSGAITMEVRVLQPNYSVAPGDTLASIARRHGTTIDALASINNLENRNSLRVGQRLIIP